MPHTRRTGNRIPRAGAQLPHTAIDRSLLSKPATARIRRTASCWYMSSRSIRIERMILRLLCITLSMRPKCVSTILLRSAMDKCSFIVVRSFLNTWRPKPAISLAPILQEHSSGVERRVVPRASTPLQRRVAGMGAGFPFVFVERVSAVITMLEFFRHTVSSRSIQISLLEKSNNAHLIFLPFLLVAGSHHELPTLYSA